MTRTVSVAIGTGLHCCHSCGSELHCCHSCGSERRCRRQNGPPPPGSATAVENPVCSGVDEMGEMVHCVAVWVNGWMTCCGGKKFSTSIKCSSDALLISYYNSAPLKCHKIIYFSGKCLNYWTLQRLFVSPSDKVNGET
jgi:hypothetical protein